MGYYIQAPTPRFKAKFFVEQYKARIVSEDEARKVACLGGNETVVVVVNNGFFEAAVLAYNLQEFDDFTANPKDDRQKEFVIMDKKLAYELADYNFPE